MPVEKRTLLFRTEVWNARTRTFELVRVLADSASEAQMCTQDYLCERSPANIRITGVNSSSTRSSSGFVYIRIGSPEQTRLVRLPATTTDSISGGATQVLLHAGTCKRLGLFLDYDIHSSDSPLLSLPQLPRGSDEHWIQQHEVASGGHPRLLAASAASIASIEEIEAHVSVSDANIGKILEDCAGDPFPKVAYSLDDIRWGVSATQDEITSSGLAGLSPGGVFTIEQARTLKDICCKYKAAFATGKIPHPNKRPPVQVELIPDPPDARWPSKPHHCPAPVWATNARKYLNKLRQFWLREGMIAANPYGPWATRLGLVGKGEEDLRQMFKALRTTEDDRPLNKRSVPYTYDMPDGPAAVEKASRPCRYSFSTDANAAFTSFRIHEDSQHYFTVWLPLGDSPADGVGKFKAKRMVFGWRNSPAVMVEWFDRMKAELDPVTRALLSSFFDDFKLNSPLTHDADEDWAVFIRSFEDFLRGCISFDIELGPVKSSGGFPVNQFFGVRIDNAGGSSLSESRVAAVRALKHPTGVSELRQVLGLLTQMRKWVNMFSDKTHSLTHLLKDGVKWDFGPQQQQDFEDLRRALIESTLNYAPDYSAELILSSDASDWAIGSRLFQVVGGIEHTIGFWSRTLTLSQTRLPVYFKELLGVLEGIRRARIYALSSPFPLRVQTDQRSLIFVDSVSKGPISAYHLASIADVNYTIEYLPGSENTCADALSRYGCDGPRALSRGGLLAAVDLLLATVGDSHRADPDIWVSAGSNTTEVARVIQRWRSASNAIGTGNPDAAKLRGTWTFAVIVPGAIQAPAVCAALLATGRHFACLLPLDLLSVVAIKHDGSFDQDAFGLLQATAKIAIPAANFCWVVAGTFFADVIAMAANCSPMTGVVAPPPSVDALRDVARMTVKQLKARLKSLLAPTDGNKLALAQRLADRFGPAYKSPVDPATADRARRLAEGVVHDDDFMYDPLDDDDIRTTHLTARLMALAGPVAQWGPLQRNSDCAEEHRVVRADGVMLFDPGDAQTRVVVPVEKRAKLMELVHTELGHNVSSMLAELKRAFHWPSMRVDVDKFCLACAGCLVNKTRILRLHGLWRHREYHRPRQFYSMDIKKMGSGDTVAYSLVIIDRFSSWLVIARLSDKRSTSVIDAIMTHVVWKFGFFSEMTIDSEKGFQSATFDAWASSFGVRVVPPLAYSPTGNAAGEVAWKHVATALKGDEAFPPDQERLNEIAFAWNTQTKAGTQFSPFLIQFGSAAVTAAVQLARGMVPAGCRPATQAEIEAEALSTAESVASVTKVAADRGNNQRRVRAADLNLASRGHLAPLAVGTRAYVYQPPSGAVVNSRGEGRNRAFVPAFTGPATVVAQLSNSGYRLVDDRSGLTYHRHRRHLRPLGDVVCIAADEPASDGE